MAKQPPRDVHAGIYRDYVNAQARYGLATPIEIEEAQRRIEQMKADHQFRTALQSFARQAAAQEQQALWEAEYHDEPEVRHQKATEAELFGAMTLAAGDGKVLEASTMPGPASFLNRHAPLVQEARRRGQVLSFTGRQGGGYQS